MRRLSQNPFERFFNSILVKQINFVRKNVHKHSFITKVELKAELVFTFQFENSMSTSKL